MANKLNDIIAIGGAAYAVTEIVREGLELFAIVKIEDNKVTIVSTHFCQELAFTTIANIMRGVK